MFGKVEHALDGGVSVLQYRDKTSDALQRRRRALALKRLCADHGALFIVNDDVALCAEISADGVHIGRHDGDLAAARTAVGARCLIGVSCYDQIALARAAQQEGADYVAFGSVFLSTVKPDAVRAPLSLFTLAARELTVPAVAIGGIDHLNAGSVIEAGAGALAVISALFDAADVRASARAFTDLFSLHHFKHSDRS